MRAGENCTVQHDFKIKTSENLLVNETVALLVLKLDTQLVKQICASFCYLCLLI